MGYRNAGMYNLANNLIPADTPTQLSWRISDHFPLCASSPPKARTAGQRLRARSRCQS